MSKSIYEILADKLRSEQEGLDAAEKVTNAVFQSIDKLEKKDIVNPVVLKIKLSEVDPKYRDGLYGLYRIAIDGGPEGSFIVLDAKKVLVIINDIDPEDDDDEPNELDKDGKKKKNKNKKIIVENGVEYEVDEKGNKTRRDKKGKKSIMGVTKKVIVSIESFIASELQALCHLVNESILHKVIHVPNYVIKGGKREVEPLDKTNKKEKEI